MPVKSSIAFGLVYIPITMTPAAKVADIGFNMLHKTKNARISYKKVVAGSDEEVPASDIVKGYRYADGKYVVFSDDDFDKLKTQKDKQITIEQFVDLGEIDPIYYEKSYYISPTGGEKAFALLQKALGEENKVGIAKTVLGNKETLIALRLVGDKMVLSTMYFYDEIQPAPAVKEESVSDAELKLAKTLIESMTKPFEPRDYKDEYRARLMEAIEQKINGQEITQPVEKQEKGIVNLMEALTASLNLQQSAPSPQ